MKIVTFRIKRIYFFLHIFIYINIYKDEDLKEEKMIIIYLMEIIEIIEIILIW